MAKKKYREDRELVALSKLGDMKAQLELWNKWYPFTQKHFFQSREVFVNSGMSLEDYTQEAYLAFATAVQKYDLEKAISKGCVNFSTYYYWYLKKLRNSANRYLDKWGDTNLWSDYLSGDKSLKDYHDDANPNDWNRAVMRDIKDDFKKVQAEEILSEFFKEETDVDLKRVAFCLLEGKKSVDRIAPSMREDLTYEDLKKMVKTVLKKLKAIASRMEFEPISYRV